MFVDVSEVDGSVRAMAALLWPLSLKNPVRLDGRGYPRVEQQSAQDCLLLSIDLNNSSMNLRNSL